MKIKYHVYLDTQSQQYNRKRKVRPKKQVNQQHLSAYKSYEYNEYKDREQATFKLNKNHVGKYWQKQYSKLREIKTLSLNDKILQVKKEKKLIMYIGHTRLYVQNGLLNDKK